MLCFDTDGWPSRRAFLSFPVITARLIVAGVQRNCGCAASTGSAFCLKKLFQQSALSVIGHFWVRSLTCVVHGK